MPDNEMERHVEAAARASTIPPAALEQHLAILGKTGAGKSFAAKGVVETILDAGGRVCVIDPTGVWAGLRTNVAGDGAGYPVVILGGKNADVAIGRTEGAAIARAVGTSSTSFVIDMLTMSHAAKVEFFRDFAQALLSENEGVLHLVIDEAHDFAPQSGSMGRDPAASDMLHAANNLVAQGRARGLRIMLLTQRPAKLHKDSLTQVESIVAMRVTAPQDRKPIEDWMVGFYGRAAAAAISTELAGLKTGEGFVASNGADPVKVTFPPIKTFDSGRPGAHAQRPLAPVDVAQLREALAAPEARESEAKVAPARLANEAEIAAAERRGYERGFADGVTAGRQQIASHVRSAVDALENSLKRVERDPVGALPQPFTPHEKPFALAPPSSSGRTPAFDAENRGSNPRGGTKAPATTDLSPTARKIVDALEAAHPVSLTFKAAALRAGASPRSSQFRLYRQQVESSGLVEMVGDRLRAVTGREAPAGTSPLDLFASRMPPSQGALLRALATATGPITKDAAADAAGISRTSSGLGAGLKELVELELAVRAGDGRYSLSTEMREAAG